MVSDDLLASVRQQVATLGFELVDFRVGGGGARPQVQVRIDREGGGPGSGVTVDDCARVSRLLERLLETSGSLGRRYVLQVSSPGVDRPVRFPEHWRRYRGRFVRVHAGTLKGHPRAQIVDVPDDWHVILRLGDHSEIALAFADLRGATLIPEESGPDPLFRK